MKGTISEYSYGYIKLLNAFTDRWKAIGFPDLFYHENLHATSYKLSLRNHPFITLEKYSYQAYL
jgi:hypothetical protein